MILALLWTNPATLPSCGFKALYRRKGESTGYTTVLTSGSTSGTTSLNITVSAPASYEGLIQSDCCSGNLSSGDPFGSNGYSTIASVITVVTNPQNRYNAHIASLYANPYDVYVNGSFVINTSGGTTITYSALYPAGSTSADIVFAANPLPTINTTISSSTITSISPVFSGGGQLQQYSGSQTPAYFEFYSTSGATSGTTAWYGNPATLPSFTLDGFNITEVDGGGITQQGNLLISYAQGSVYGAGVSPYNSLTLTITQADNSTELGTMTVDPTIKGLREVTISMIKGTTVLDQTTQYKLWAYWADDSLISTSLFYIPIPV